MWRATFAISLVFVSVAVPSESQTFTVLHYFTGGGDGANPYSGLTIDAQGNLYGTAYWGGTGGYNCSEYGPGCGVVYKLKPTTHGWVFNTLYQFTGGSDGANPQARVVIGPDGSLYGTTWEGGVPCPSNPVYGCGTVFNLRPPPTFCSSVQCPWRETVLYRFTGGPTDGALPFADLTFDQAGNIYGTTMSGGNTASACYFGQDWCGTVFQLLRANGGWIESVLYRFSGWDGAVPESGVTLDAAGNIYGTTLIGGASNVGTVYELTRSGPTWTENARYSLSCGTSGCYPSGDLVFDDAGNLYGTTQDQPSAGGGSVFELSLAGNRFSLVKVYAIANNVPYAGVTMDSAGNLYGTAFGMHTGQLGQVFKLTSSPCCWSYTLLHHFTADDGSSPMSTVTMDAHGNLYGTTSGGFGEVWEITP